MAVLGLVDSMLYNKKTEKRKQCANFTECQMIAFIDDYCGACKKKYRLFNNVHAYTKAKRAAIHKKQMSQFI